MWAAACSSCAAIASSSARAMPVLEIQPLVLNKKRWQKKRFRCSSTRSGEDVDQTDTPRPLKVAVSVVTELLRALRSASQPLDRVDDACKASNESLVRGVDDVLAILRLDYKQSYFLTGNFTSAIYADDCLFEDPTIKFQGKDLYLQNLELLLPFFDQPSLTLKQIKKGVNDEREFVVATWSLRLLGIRRVGTFPHSKQFFKYSPLVLERYLMSEVAPARNEDPSPNLIKINLIKTGLDQPG